MDIQSSLTLRVFRVIPKMKGKPFHSLDLTCPDGLPVPPPEYHHTLTQLIGLSLKDRPLRLGRDLFMAPGLSFVTNFKFIILIWKCYQITFYNATSVILSYWPIKTIMRYLLIPDGMAIIEKTKENKCWRRRGERELLYPVGGNVNWYNHYGKQYGRFSRN